MISHTHKFVFLHYPKTAGISVGYKLKNQKIIKNFEYTPDIHYETNLTKALQHNYFIFSTKRNSYDRVVSLWKYWNKRLRENNLPTYGFSNFVKNFYDIKRTIITKFGYLEQVHFQSFHTCIRTMTHNKLSIQDVDYFMEFSNLQTEWGIICSKLGISTQTLWKRNSTKHKHYTEYYDDETRQIVAEKYAKDIEYFGYEFGE